MELVYIKLYLDDRDAMEALTDAEKGRLVTAMLEYASTGREQQLSGNERILYPMFRARIDRDIASMEADVEKKRAAGKKGRQVMPASDSECQQMSADGSKDKRQKTKDNRQQTIDEDNIPSRAVVDLFNDICVSLPQVKSVTDARRAAVRSRLNDIGGDMDEMRRIFEEIEASDFLSGRSGKWSGCSFDWIFKPANFTKIREGNYDNREHPAESNGRYAPTYDTDEIERMLDERFMEG